MADDEAVVVAELVVVARPVVVGAVGDEVVVAVAVDASWKEGQMGEKTR